MSTSDPMKMSLIFLFPCFSLTPCIRVRSHCIRMTDLIEATAILTRVVNGKMGESVNAKLQRRAACGSVTPRPPFPREFVSPAPPGSFISVIKTFSLVTSPLFAGGLPPCSLEINSAVLVSLRLE